MKGICRLKSGGGQLFPWAARNPLLVATPIETDTSERSASKSCSGGWIVAATMLLGINQGLCWSMTQTAKLDITRADQRGLTMGLNEFAGYVGVALAGVITAYAADALGARLGLLIFGMAVVVTALVLTVVWVKDTLPWAKAETAAHKLRAPKSRLAIRKACPSTPRRPRFSS